jgi:aryl-alcohol dehydrogenase-like predicted oxidoreductase
MEIRNLGLSGLKVSLVGLGCNNFGGRTAIDESRAVIHAALDHGVTLFDTADIYGGRGGSEVALGQWLGPRRKDIVLASKFGMQMDEAGVKQGGSRRYIMQAVEDSLRRLKTDWIDLYQFHRPDPATPIEETLRALDDLIAHGKVRYIGCSNMAAWSVVDAHWTAAANNLSAFVSAQDEYSLLFRKPEADLIPALRAKGMGLLPYYPLASGLLSGKYAKGAAPSNDTRFGKDARSRDRYLTEDNWARVEKLAAFTQARGRTLLELAFSWLAAQGVVSSVIAGATKPEQIAANVAAASWKLTSGDLAEIDQLTA